MSSDQSVRPSRDGDQFHYHWAARQCLNLLAGTGDLKVVSIEGASSFEDDTPVFEGDQLIDVGLYYGSDALKDARQVHYIQLKHSTKSANKPWAASGLKNTLSGFAKRYVELKRNYPELVAERKFQFSFVTNRPISDEVRETLEDLAHERSPRHQETWQTLTKYTALVGVDAVSFFRVFDAAGDEPNLWAQRNLLTVDIRTYLAGADYDVPVKLKELVSRKATSEFVHDPAIRRHDVLRALQTTEEDLQPAPCMIDTSSGVFARAQESAVLKALLETLHPIILHADGGVGKSILALRLSRNMPTGSVAVLYDSFGNGLYRNSLHFRHRHRDALVQIANELSAKGLCHPLIPVANTDKKNLVRAFVGRLAQAVGLLRAHNAQAILGLIIDAADNAEMAANEQEEASFVRDLICTPLPDGVKLLLTCRTHRQALLDPPPSAQRIELLPFSLEESAKHLRQAYPEATQHDAEEFAFLSSSNPRVQALAIDRNLPIEELLRALGPTPSTVDRAIGTLLQAAIDNLKHQVGPTESSQIELICQGLAVLRPFVPISVLAQIAHIPESAVRTFAFDIGRPIFVKGESLHFLDEPTETWFREQFKPDRANLTKFLDRLRPLSANSSYVASTLPQLLVAAGFTDELVELALSGGGLPTSNPLERRDVEIQRLKYALKSCLTHGKYVAAAKLALKTGGETAGEALHTRLLRENTDLAAALLAPDQIYELVARRKFDAGWMGAHHAYEAGLLAGRAESYAEARSRLRMALDWLDAWARLPPEERQNEGVDDLDRVELAMVYLRVVGPRQAVRFLRGWRPRHLGLVTSKLLARRLFDLGRSDLVDALAEHGSNDVWLMLGLAIESREAGHLLPSETMTWLIRVLGDRRVRLMDSTAWDARDDVLIAVTASICIAVKVLPANYLSWAEILRRYLPEKPSAELADHFGFRRVASLLRAYALEAALRGTTLSLVDIARRGIREESNNNKKQGRSFETSRFEESVGGVLPWFTLGAEIVCGQHPQDLRGAIEAALKATASASSKDHHKQYGFEQVAAVEWIRVLRDANASDKASVDAVRSWFMAKRDILWTDTFTSMCRVAARMTELSEVALELAVATFKLLDRSREHAETRADSYQRLARAVFPVSAPEASVYFDRAVEVSSRIGDENLDRWTALLCLAESSEKDNRTRSRTAYRLSRVAELTYEYVARDKYFDWDRSVDALASLCGPSVLAILSRWRDRDFGEPERLLPVAIYNLVRSKRLPAIAPVTLCGFAAHWNRLEDIDLAIRAESNAERQQSILRVGYRYLRTGTHPTKTWIGLADLGRLHSVDLMDVDRLVAVAQSAEEATAQSEQSYRPSGAWLRRDPDWDALFRGVDLSDSDALKQAYAELRTFDPPYRLEEFYKQGIMRCGPGKAAEFVEAIASWPDFGITDLRYLHDALSSSATRPISLVRALHDAVLVACRNNPHYVRRHGWESTFPYGSLVSDGVVTNHEIVNATLDGFTDQVMALDASGLFALLDPLAALLSPDEAEETINFGIDLLESTLTPEDSDGLWHEDLQPPTTCNDALAGYLWAALGSPRAATRWEAAHAVRNCIELDWKELLPSLNARALAGEATPFVDKGLIFYKWHARQWLLIALARAAIERPVAVKVFTEFVAGSLIEEHVLIRHFAAFISTRLSVDEMTPTDATLRIYKPNFSALPYAMYSGSRNRSRGDESLVESEDVKEYDEYYFGVDIGPYWFAPLGRVFGVNAGFVTKCAAQVLRERFGVTSTSYNDDARYKRQLFRDRSTSHSHGSTPRVDDLRAYLAYHAMMIVAARLLETHQIGKDESASNDDLTEWLDRYALTRMDGRWVSDRRDPHLIKEPPNAPGHRDKTWCWRVTAEYLDQQLLADDGLHVLWGHWTSGSGEERETVSVRSALACRETSNALLAAFQTAPDWGNIHISSLDDTDVGEESEAGKNDAFCMRSWVLDQNEPSGVDEYDPWGERTEYPGPALDPGIVTTLGLTAIDCDARQLKSALGSHIRSETWTQVVGTGREQDTVTGTRLSANDLFLQALFAAYPDQCMIVSVSVRRAPPSSRSDEDEFESYPWPYTRYYLVDKDGIARSLKRCD